MDKIGARQEMMRQAWLRVSAMEFGDPVTNICAGDNSPRRHAYFVNVKTKATKNRYGVVHRERWAKCTDKKGAFWDTGIEAVYPGHLSTEIANRLFEQVHALLY